jgi:MYXO-CTERM domain-containing protein
MRISFGSFAAPFALASLVLAACGSDGAPGAKPSTNLGKTASPVIHGELDSGTAHDDVVYIAFAISATEGGACTGTLISPNVVITARHCVSQIDESVYPPRAGADFDIKNMGVYLHTDPKGGLGGSPNAGVVKIVHDSATSLGDHDFAMIVLDKNIGATYSQIRLASGPHASESVFVVGYGITETDTPSSLTAPHQRYWRDGLSILEVGPTTDGFAGPSEIILGESICQGDSGGPVKDHASGALLAVTSRGGNGSPPSSSYPAQPCVGSGTYNLFTRVDKFASLIKSTLASLGEIPWEEGAPKPPDPTTPPPAGELGSPCTTGSDCNTGICVDADGSMVCSRHCSSTEPCPSGYDCAGGYCVPASAPPPPPDDDAGTPPTDDSGTTPPPGDQPSPDANTTDDTKGGCAVAVTSPSTTTRTSALSALALALAGLAIVRRRRRR